MLRRPSWILTDKNCFRVGVRVFGLAFLLAFCTSVAWAVGDHGVVNEFPPPLDSYGDAGLDSIAQVLTHRIQTQPFNLVASLIFLCAIVHTFMATRFMSLSQARARAYREKIRRGEAEDGTVDTLAGVFHFLGEVEVVFGLWVAPLIIALVLFYDWPTVVDYIDHGVKLDEPAFVFVIMVLASTRPILRLAESVMLRISGLIGGNLAAFWFTVMTIGPLLGSFITEPAAMTICALLLSHKFYDLGPSQRFRYATLGLLFVNISVGGTLTHFAAPPILMVAAPWGWDTSFMLFNFGWKAVVGIVLCNGLYFWWFRGELAVMEDRFALRVMKEDIGRRFVPRILIEKQYAGIAGLVAKEHDLARSIHDEVGEFTAEARSKIEADLLPKLEAEGAERDLVKEALDERFNEVMLMRLRRAIPGVLDQKLRPEFHDPDWDKRDDAVPGWVVVVHLLFMAWTIMNAHEAPLFLLGLLFFLGFARVTASYQNEIRLEPAILVGFFLAGLVIHGGLQGWWIEPVLGSLDAFALMLGATVLTSFNDNAAITYLSTLVPGFTDEMKYVVVAGAVTGGGLTVIANAPNPAGQSVLKQHFSEGISPTSLLVAALGPTAILWLCFALL